MADIKKSSGQIKKNADNVEWLDALIEKFDDIRIVSDEPGLMGEYLGEIGFTKSKFHKALESGSGTDGKYTLFPFYSDYSEVDFMLYIPTTQLDEVEKFLSMPLPKKKAVKDESAETLTKLVGAAIAKIKAISGVKWAPINESFHLQGRAWTSGKIEYKGSSPLHCSVETVGPNKLRVNLVPHYKSGMNSVHLETKAGTTDINGLMPQIKEFLDKVAAKDNAEIPLDKLLKLLEKNGIKVRDGKVRQQDVNTVKQLFESLKG
jgi:hypothetical protein